MHNNKKIITFISSLILSIMLIEPSELIEAISPVLNQISSENAALVTSGLFLYLLIT